MGDINATIPFDFGLYWWMGGTDDGFKVEFLNGYFNIPNANLTDFLSVGVFNFTADVAVVESFPLLMFPTTLSFAKEADDLSDNINMMLRAREVGEETTAPADYGLVPGSPVFPSGYTFESDDVLIYSWLRVGNEYIYDGAAAMAFGPDSALNVFAREEIAMNVTTAASIVVSFPDMSGGVQLDDMDLYFKVGASMDDSFLVEVEATGSEVVGTVNGENYVNATMGGSIFMGGTDDGYAIEIDQLWIDVAVPIEFSFGVLDVTADVTELWFIIPTYDSMLEVTYSNPDTSFSPDMHFIVAGKEIGTRTSSPDGYDLVDSPFYPSGYSFEKGMLPCKIERFYVAWSMANCLFIA